MMMRMTMAATVLVTLTLATGCDNAKDQQVLELQRQLELLEQGNADLEGQLSLAMKDGEDARRRALEIQRMYDQCRSELASARNRPAPQPIMQPAPVQNEPSMPSGWSGTDKIAMTEVESDILFASGQANLTKAGVSAISRVASQIQSDFAGRHIWVIGHTDSDPIKKSKWKDNLELSLQRGAAVARELLGRGVDARNMVVAGQGEHNPKGSSKTKNRRVEIFAVDSSVMGS